MFNTFYEPIGLLHRNGYYSIAKPFRSRSRFDREAVSIVPYWIVSYWIVEQTLFDRKIVTVTGADFPFQDFQRL